VPSFLAPKLRDLLPDPLTIQDMDRAAARLADAVTRRERVAIFGDYDVDGACASALLGGYLRDCGIDYEIHIPDRITEGYGPNVEAIRALAARGAGLLVTVDCGTSSHEPLAEARRLGQGTIVLDHHQAPELLPPADALVNPNRQDDLSGLGHLCAAGVVFLTLVALNRTLRERGFFAGRAEPNLLESLDLVALATVADVVPLNGLNRAFVRQGLAVMRGRRRPGLAALLDVAGLSESPEGWHLGYLVGPRINAGGRIGDAGLGARLLLTEDPENASRIAAELDRLNRERQDIEKAALLEAEAQAHLALEAHPDCPVVVTASSAWHPGVGGFSPRGSRSASAARPSPSPSNPEGMATGSGRSVAGADLGRAVRAAVDIGLAVKGGGHGMAAGATVPGASIPAFAEFISERLAAAVGDARRVDGLSIDATLTAGGARPELVQAIERAGPFGPMPRARFASGSGWWTQGGRHGHVRVAFPRRGSWFRHRPSHLRGSSLGQALLAARGGRATWPGTLT
jgi:single-stranded-DNA-specific exonuclease